MRFNAGNVAGIFNLVEDEDHYTLKRDHENMVQRDRWNRAKSRAVDLVIMVEYMNEALMKVEEEGGHVWL